MTHVLAFLALMAGLLTSPALAQVATKNEAWSFGLGGFAHTLRSKEGYGLSGNATAVQLGRGHIGTDWFASGTIDVISGPFHANQKQVSSIDYTGTGLTVGFGYGLTPALRGERFSYGLSLGLRYADIVGRNIAASKPEPGVSVDGAVMRVNDFSLMPGVFLSWLEPARPAGNKPSLLTTRLEGYVLSFAVGLPLLASASVKYQRTDAHGSVGQSTTARLSGYSLILQLSALLGA